MWFLAVPRNEKKFGNFVKNSLNVRSDVIVKEIWTFLSSKQAEATAEQEKEQAAASQATEKESSNSSKDGDAQAAASSKKRSSPSSLAASKGKEEKQHVDEERSPSKRSKVEDSKASNSFNWHKAIGKVLKTAPGKSLPLKVLRRNVTALYNDDANSGDTTSKSDLKAAFKEALKTHPKATQEGKGESAVVTYGSKTSV